MKLSERITVTAFIRRFVPMTMGAILFGWGVFIPLFASWNPSERIIGSVRIFGVPFIPNTLFGGLHFGSWSFGFAWWDDLFVLVTGCYLLATAIQQGDTHKLTQTESEGI